MNTWKFWMMFALWGSIGAVAIWIAVGYLKKAEDNWNKASGKEH